MKKTKSFGEKSIIMLLIVLMIIHLVPLSVFSEANTSDNSVSDSLGLDDYNVEKAEEITRESDQEVIEVKELRSETVKHFRCEDGSYVAAQYNTPIHYLDDDKIWQDIDNTLSESGNEYVTYNA